MNEQLQLALKAILDKVLDSMDATVDFLSGQIPIVVREVLVWNFTYFIIQFLFCITFTVVATVLLWKKWERLKVLWDGFGLPTGVCLYLAGLLFSWDGCMNLEWLKIWLAPRLWLVEYATSLVK